MPASTYYIRVNAAIGAPSVAVAYTLTLMLAVHTQTLLSQDPTSSVRHHLIHKDDHGDTATGRARDPGDFNG